MTRWHIKQALNLLKGCQERALDASSYIEGDSRLLVQTAIESLQEATALLEKSERDLSKAAISDGKSAISWKL